MTPPCNQNVRPGPRWSREQIRSARLALLPPLLQRADSNSTNARQETSFCPTIPVSSARTPIGAGPNATWPVTPSTSTSRFLASHSTTPCARSPVPKTTAGVARLRRQRGAKSRRQPQHWRYDGSLESRPAARRLRPVRRSLGERARQRGAKSSRSFKTKNDSQRQDRTTRTRLFGHKLRHQCSQTSKKPTTSNQPKVRCQKSS